jgi:integrase
MRLTKTINHGKSRWRVSTRLNGKRTQRFFTTRKQARVWMRSVQANASVEDFWKLRSSEEKSEIVELFHEAEAKAVRLKDLQSSLVKYQKFDLIRLDDAVKNYFCVISKRSFRPSSAKQTRINLNQLSEEFGDRDCRSINPSDLEQWFGKRNWKRSTVDGVLAKIGPFFTWCVREAIILENPCTKVVKPLNFDHGSPVIFTVEDTARLLQVAQSIDPPIAKYLAIGLFAGIRPNEIIRLDNSDINERYIEVKGTSAKTRKRRIVSVLQNLKNWLRIAESLPKKNLRRRREIVIEQANVDWAHDVMRHTYASYHLAYHQSADKTALEMGHRDTQMLFRHYRSVVTKDEAAKFWKIEPSRLA